MPVRTTQLDHVAMGLRRIADAPPFAEGVLGGVPQGGGPGNREFRWAQWRFAGGGVLEFLEPAGPAGGFLERFLARRGPGVHHATFKVPRLDAALRRAGELGYRAVGLDDSDPGWKEAFLHPKEALGIVVQIVEAADEPDGEGPEPGPGAARVVALRMRVRDLAAARRQWVELLGARESVHGGERRYRFGDAPIELRVEEDRAAEEGPVQIEVAAAQRLALPEGPHPELGVRFVQVEAPRPAARGASGGR